MSYFILIFSFLFQCAAAFLAFRGWRIARGRWAWLSVSGAFFLMALRQGIILFLLVFGGSPINLKLEAVILVGSFFLLLGIAPISRRLATDRRKTEAEQQRIEKLESLGLLASGIAHDFNNLLTAILGNINIVKKGIDPASPSLERIVKAERASHQAKGLAHKLLTFTRGGKPVKLIASLKRILRDSADFAITGSNVRCEFVIADNLWLSEIDVDQIGQVMNNLVINAVQAMPQGGVIHIEAENVSLEDQNDYQLPAGRYLKIRVQDRGEGIPPENLPRIFDPYFTTKEKGSGLGLASAETIVRQHAGRISVVSSPGAGSTFTFFLPASEKRARRTKKKIRESSVRKVSILVMDSEALVRDAAEKMLLGLGYDVVLAEGGEQTINAYRRARRNGRPFAAVIIDLTVPGGMGGKEILQQLKEIDPEVRAVVSSGYTDDPVISDYETFGFLGTLRKPYQAQEMSEVLERVLREPS
jgi:two-component system cell cycle sensor histidine kinase/response regulator CckA